MADAAEFNQQMEENKRGPLAPKADLHRTSLSQSRLSLNGNSPSDWDPSRRRSTLKRPPMKVITYRLNFVQNAKSKVRSMENINYRPGRGGGNLDSQSFEWSGDAAGEDQRNFDNSGDNQGDDGPSFYINEKDGTAVRVTVVDGPVKRQPPRKEPPPPPPPSKLEFPMQRKLAAELPPRPKQELPPQPKQELPPQPRKELPPQPRKEQPQNPPRRFTKFVDDSQTETEIGDRDEGDQWNVRNLERRVEEVSTERMTKPVYGDNDADGNLRGFAGKERGKQVRNAVHYGVEDVRKVREAAEDRRGDKVGNVKRSKVPDRGTSQRNVSVDRGNARQVAEENVTTGRGPRDWRPASSVASADSDTTLVIDSSPQTAKNRTAKSDLDKRAHAQNRANDSSQQLPYDPRQSDYVYQKAALSGPHYHQGGRNAQTVPVADMSRRASNEAQPAFGNNRPPGQPFGHGHGNGYQPVTMSGKGRKNGPRTDGGSVSDADSSLLNASFAAGDASRREREVEHSGQAAVSRSLPKGKSRVNVSLDQPPAPNRYDVVEKIDFSKDKQAVVFKFQTRRKTQLPRVAYLTYPGDPGPSEWNLLPRADKTLMKKEQVAITYASIHDRSIVGQQLYEQQVQNKQWPSQFASARDSMQPTDRTTGRDEHPNWASKNLQGQRSLPPIDSQSANVSYRQPVDPMDTQLAPEHPRYHDDEDYQLARRGKLVKNSAETEHSVASTSKKSNVPLPRRRASSGDGNQRFTVQFDDRNAIDSQHASRVAADASDRRYTVAMATAGSRASAPETDAGHEYEYVYVRRPSEEQRPQKVNVDSSKQSSKPSRSHPPPPYSFQLPSESDARVSDNDKQSLQMLMDYGAPPADLYAAMMYPGQTGPPQQFTAPPLGAQANLSAPAYAFDATNANGIPTKAVPLRQRIK